MKPLLGPVLAFLTILISGSSFAQDDTAGKGPGESATPTLVMANMSDEAKKFETLRRERLAEIQAIKRLEKEQENYKEWLNSDYDKQQKLNIQKENLHEPETAQTLDGKLSNASSEKTGIQSELGTAKRTKPQDINRINTLNGQLGQVTNYIQYLEYQKKNIDQDTKSFQDKKKDLTDQLSAVNETITRDDEGLRKTKTNLEKQNLALQETEHNISLLFAQSEQTNDFKTAMSRTFAILVGAVILFFFVVVWRDKDVGRSIFAHEWGIQFVTLFSLVIAIILFGIIGILEGKELAALLGGLSGYILGRGTGPALRTPTQEDRGKAGGPSGPEDRGKAGGLSGRALAPMGTD